MRIAQIHPKNDDDLIYKIKYDPNKTIKDIKKFIKYEYGIPLFCQKLYINKNELMDDKKLSFYTNTDNIELYNMNQLRVVVNLKHKPIEYFIKASDSIYKLKEDISKDFNIPINKIRIFNSNQIVNDDILLEDFLFNLNFEANLLEADKIKINLIDENENNIKTIIVDPFSYTNAIYNKVEKNYDFKLTYNGTFIDVGKLITQYNIENGDNIDIVKCDSKKIELQVIFGEGKSKTVIVFPHEPLYRLLDLLKITDKSINFTFNDIIYPIASIQTFEEIGITSDSKIFLIGQN